MLSSGLPISRYVNVSVSMTTPGVIGPAINTLMVMGSSDVIDAGERARLYANISELARDFQEDSEEFLSAEAWFSQNPRPSNVMIGRWVQTATAGGLVCGILTIEEEAILKWITVDDGSFKVAVDGDPAVDITGLDFSSETNLNGVATVINEGMAAAPGGGVDAEVVWNGAEFVFKTASTGVTASMSFLSAAGSGTDISTMMRGTALTGARGVPGSAPESAVSGLAQVDSLYSTQFYAVVMPSAEEQDQLELAAYCEAASPPHYFGVTVSDTATLSPLSTDDLASQLTNFGYNRTAMQYSTVSPYAICSYLARILTTEWRGTNTTITLMYKQEPGVAVEFLTSNQADLLRQKNCNVYVGVANGAQMIQYGTSASGEYTDTIIGADALALDIQNTLFNSMYATSTKIPQTDAGMSILENAVTGICSQYTSNGFLGPGVWNAPGFGTLDQGDTMPLGFYVFAPTIAVQSVGDRAARRAPLIQVAARCASAIHEVGLSIAVMA